MSLVERRNLVDAALVTAAAERRIEKSVDQIAREAGSRQPFAQRQHIRIVVLTTETRRRLVDDGRGADAGNLVGGHRHADARTAEEQSTIELAACNGARDGLGEVGIINGLDALRSEIPVRNSALVEELSNLGFQVDAGMIGAERDAHARQYSQTPSAFRARPPRQLQFP